MNANTLQELVKVHFWILKFEGAFELDCGENVVPEVKDWRKALVTKL
jgi:hypothetical protein